MSLRATLALTLIAFASPAMAEERDFCANRPGLDTPSCTLAPGSAMVEVGLGEWDHSAGSDTVVLADTTLRLGVTPRSELFVGFTPYVHERTSAATGGIATSQSGTGDAVIGWRRGLAGPNGPVAIQPFVTFPVGSSSQNSGDWGTGVVMPIGLPLGSGFQLAISPELDAAVNSAGKGRHLAFGSAMGLSHPLGPAIAFSLEAAVMRDNDPQGAETQAKMAAALAWQVAPNLQLDLEFDHRLAGGVPGHALLFGIAKRLR